jgi:hypothetical protein
VVGFSGRLGGMIGERFAGQRHPEAAKRFLPDWRVKRLVVGPIV